MREYKLQASKTVFEKSKFSMQFAACDKPGERVGVFVFEKTVNERRSSLQDEKS
jgi:hypothetical protein